ncbi:uncharacterized protein LOC117679697 isoform X1 [Pantherophis guttatus]|uniref:Uncharacterized protein LOC117679697 isoform X1 n=1 Tax=Pantherophis guttatus TaxID=94885 RepID=A0ABM3YW70_PANGU|nr:uncharacterized protein LOC117679697 isoform X1 [Pantherophis guttatus]
MKSLVFVGILFYILGSQAVVSIPFPTGTVRTECRDRYFWIWLDKSALGQNSWSYSVFNELGQRISVTDYIATQCGFTHGVDLYGNPEIRISFLACSVRNVFDKDFSIRLQVEITSLDNVTAAYEVSMNCPLDAPWSPREIVCEENYMEVSVRRAVPGIANDALNDDWMAVWPVAQGAMNQVWQVVFHFQNGSVQDMMATQAYDMGYGFNTTATRVLFRTPYGTQQTEVATVQGLEVEVARATIFYKQAWMILIVDTVVACPINPPTFTATALRWTSPRIMPALVAFPLQFEDETIEMGVDGRRIDRSTIVRNGYSFLTDMHFISITVPIGALGGITESDVIDNRYGTTYTIKLLLDRRWRGDESDWTRHRIFKSIRTPFAPQIPLLTDNTVPERGYFDVTIGNFLADVELTAITIGGKLLSPPEIKGHGCTLEEVPNANHTRVFVLKVPFSNPLVEQKYLYGNFRKYTLHLEYTFFLLPKGKSFTHPGVIECEVADVVLPLFEGFCEEEQIGVRMTRGNLDRYWVPYVGSLQLTNELAASQNYTIQDDGSYFYLSVPFLATGLMYEDISLNGVTVRLDFGLRDNKTLLTMVEFSRSCVFPTGKLLVCFPNGTMIATMLSLDTKPELNPRRTHLRDKNCRPVGVDDTKALFTFSVATCGTIRRFEENYLVYENEVIFEREMIPEEKPVITRDPQYRLTLRCRYRLDETLRVWAQRLLKEGVAAGLHPFHLKAYQKKRAANGHVSHLAGGASTDAKGKTWLWFLAFSVALCGLATTIDTLLPVQLFGH